MSHGPRSDNDSPPTLHATPRHPRYSTNEYRVIGDRMVCNAKFEWICGAFGGNRGLRPVPPEKGVFPLDHLHECDLEKKDYLSCLKSSGHNSQKCKDFSKKYLQCRMQKNLMAKQDMSELGFGKDDLEASF
ncbi:hypothetical protein ACFE04_021127 [Oxalis oulophora]